MYVGCLSRFDCLDRQGSHQACSIFRCLVTEETAIIYLHIATPFPLSPLNTRFYVYQLHTAEEKGNGLKRLPVNCYVGYLVSQNINAAAS